MKKLFILFATIFIIIVLLVGMWAILSGFTFGVPGRLYVEIEQDVDIQSILDETYRVGTSVWVINWEGFSRGLVYRIHNIVKCDDIPITKETQKRLAMPHYLKTKEKLKTYMRCKYVD